MEIVPAAGKQVGVDRCQLETAMAKIDGRIERWNMPLPLVVQPVFDRGGVVQEMLFQIQHRSGERRGEMRNHREASARMRVRGSGLGRAAGRGFSQNQSGHASGGGSQRDGQTHGRSPKGESIKRGLSGSRGGAKRHHTYRPSDLPGIGQFTAVCRLVSLRAVFLLAGRQPAT